MVPSATTAPQPRPAILINIVIRLLVPLFVLAASPLAAAEPTPAERGYKALTETAFIPAFWTSRVVQDAWKTWPGITERPANYAAAFREHYGLHEAPYLDGSLPMGLRKAKRLFNDGIGADCMLCHGGSLLGKSYVGLGNSSLDIQALFEDFNKVDGLPKPPFTFGNVRGTNEADGFGVYLLGFRNPDLTPSGKYVNLGLRDDTCADVPAWWLMKKKRTMYYTGATDSRSVRSLMQFMMHPLNGPEAFTKAEPAFRDIQAFLLGLEPPKYPFAINKDNAAKGEAVFKETCARCHGTYGEKWTYPNKVIPLDEIGTDPVRHAAVSAKYGRAYSESWFGKDGKPLRATDGYQAPPLDGIWATAPYLHNGSVPTLYGVLNSKSRPKVFTRSYHTSEADYNKEHVGWKVTELSEPLPARASGYEKRKVYDTSKTGRGNAGHTFGDDLTDEQRRAVIEYLKTL
jgi:mono/diheme cytochrome c family protein